MGVVPVIYSKIFQERTLKYDINTYLPLAEYKARITSREQLSNFFLSIIDTYQKAESYLLDTSYFLLEEEYVYVNEATGKACLIMYPVVGVVQEKDLRQLFCKMMNGIRLVERDMGFYGKVIYELDYAESFNIVKFRELLSSSEIDNNIAVSLRNLDTESVGSSRNPVRPGTLESPIQTGQPGEPKPVAGEQDDFPDLHGGKPGKESREKKKEKEGDLAVCLAVQARKISRPEKKAARRS